MFKKCRSPQLQPPSEYFLTASRWMDREEAWGVGGVGVGFWDQCTLIGRRINQSSPWGAVESNSERLKCFVWVSPMAWPCWLSVSQGELYLLQLQALYCRTLFKLRRNPYTQWHKHCRSLLSQAITTDSDQRSLTMILLLDSLGMLFFRGIYFVCGLTLKAHIQTERLVTAAALSRSFFFH